MLIEIKKKSRLRLRAGAAKSYLQKSNGQDSGLQLLVHIDEHDIDIPDL
jgi:hypothetical protein